MRGNGILKIGSLLMAGLLATTSGLTITAAQAQAQGQSYSFDIPGMPVARAVNELGRVTGLSVVFSENRRITATARPVKGAMTVEQALSTLLAGTGLDYRFSNANTVEIYDTSGSAEAAGIDGATFLGTVIIQGKLAYSGAVEGYLAPATGTGVKAGAPLAEVPQSISIVTSTELEDRQPAQIEDAIKYTAGINASTWGTDDRYDQFSIRGFDMGTGAIYRDGLSQKAVNFSAFSTEPYMVERIDVLRGPAGVLYGSNDAGGMINLVTKRPTFDRLAEGKLSYASHNTKTAAFDWSNTINESGTLAGRLTGLVRDGSTYLEGSENDRMMLAGGLTWSPSDYTALTFLAHVQKDSLTPVGTIPVAGEDYDASWGVVSKDWGTVQPDYDHFKTNQQSFGWDFTHEFSTELTLSQRARYAHQTTDYQQIGYSNTDVNGHYHYPFIVDENANTLGVDTYLEWKRAAFGGENSLVFGAEYQRRRLNNKLYMGSNFLIPFGADESLNVSFPAPGLVTDSHTTYVEKSVYLQDHLKLESGTALTFGVRRAWLDNTLQDDLYGGSDTQKNSATTFMAGVTHEFANGLTPYMSYTTGFIQNIGTTITGAVLDPSESKQWEAGLRYQPNEDLLLSMAVFDLRKTNVADYDTNDPTWSSFTQVGEIRSRGVELEVRGRLTDTLQGVASYTYLDTEIIKTSVASQLGNEAAMAPHNQISFWLDYDASALLPGLTIGAGARYVSDSYSTQDNLRVTPSYTVADLSVGYAGDGYNLDLGVTNLFGRDYYGNCYDGFGCIKGEGRQVSLTLSKSF